MYSVLDCGINYYKFEYETGFPSTDFKVEIDMGTLLTSVEGFRF
jgi:hypothetical protein